MDGDFAPMVELVKLLKKYGFLLVLDDPHGTFVCGKSGGGVAEEFNCERDIDICIGTLSKAAGCHGGFIAQKAEQFPYIVLFCSNVGLQQAKGGSISYNLGVVFLYFQLLHQLPSLLQHMETWHRRAIWNQVQDFHALTGIRISSPIISLIVGSEEKALLASRHLLESGFHVTTIRWPTVPSNSCRLRVTLTAVRTTDDIKKLTTALSRHINLEDIPNNSSNVYSKL
ncbi:hypothetical protein Pint_18017 [Pistacia integerrima]|uniref:Uncharacterized protein n=1 Tax=Pistacia integerrima TaxID=434235 RepID=A0ACC0YW43_9ROSI|nr:hypothetical protein Pint_18017 [Pistacia integerrima]